MSFHPVNMTTLLGAMDKTDYFTILLIATAFFAVAGRSNRGVNLGRLEAQTREIQRKLDALLKEQGIRETPPIPSGLSPEVERLVNDPRAQKSPPSNSTASRILELDWLMRSRRRGQCASSKT